MSNNAKQIVLQALFRALDEVVYTRNTPASQREFMREEYEEATEELRRLTLIFKQKP